MSPKLRKKEPDEKEKSTKKIVELNALLKASKQLEETYFNQLKYARADLENLQKQMQRRIDEGITRGAERLITRLLPVVEELDLAIEAMGNTKNRGLLEGIEMVKKKFNKVLSDEGLSALEAVGKPFDPSKHEAVLEVDTCDYPDGTVIEEIRKGYTFKGKVLRASMVKVARNYTPIEGKSSIPIEVKKVNPLEVKKSSPIEVKKVNENE